MDTHLFARRFWLSHKAIFYWYTVRDFESIATKAQGDITLKLLHEQAKIPKPPEEAKALALDEEDIDLYENYAKMRKDIDMLKAEVGSIRNSMHSMWLDTAIKCNGIR